MRVINPDRAGRARSAFLVVAALLVAAACSPSAPPRQERQEEGTPRIIAIEPAFATDPLGDDADDPAVWLHPDDPKLSLILGTNKAAAPNGGLGVFDLEGKLIQLVDGIDRPNNVDVEYGLETSNGPIDIAVVTERYQRRLRVFRIDPATRELHDVSRLEGLAVFEGEEGEAGAPMGVGLYKRPADGAIFAILSRKSGPADGYLGQYRLEADEEGRVAARQVRRFGRFSGTGEIEAVAVDDELGFVYYSDEGTGVRKVRADPGHPDAGEELALFAADGFVGDREGIAIYAEPAGAGYILITDQIDGGSRYHVYPRTGDLDETLAILSGPADATDGLEAAAPLNLLIAMHSAGRNFLAFDWRQIRRELE